MNKFYIDYSGLKIYEVTDISEREEEGCWLTLACDQKQRPFRVLESDTPSLPSFLGAKLELNRLILRDLCQASKLIGLRSKEVERLVGESIGLGIEICANPTAPGLRGSRPKKARLTYNTLFISKRIEDIGVHHSSLLLLAEAAQALTLLTGPCTEVPDDSFFDKQYNSCFQEGLTSLRRYRP